MTMGMLKIAGKEVRLCVCNKSLHTGDSKSLNRSYFEILLPIIELSKVSLSAFGEHEVRNWKGLFTKITPHVVSALGRGSCASESLACIHIFIKFGVFEKEEVCAHGVD